MENMEWKGGGKLMKDNAEEENNSRMHGKKRMEGEKITGRKRSLEEGKIMERSLVRNRMKEMKVQ